MSYLLTKFFIRAAEENQRIINLTKIRMKSIFNSNQEGKEETNEEKQMTKVFLDV